MIWIIIIVAILIIYYMREQENFSCKPCGKLSSGAPAALNPFVFPYSTAACVDNYYKSSMQFESPNTPDHVPPE